MTYLISKNEVLLKVAICIPGLDLTFFDMELEELDDESALGSGDVGPLGDANPLASI